MPDRQFYSGLAITSLVVLGILTALGYLVPEGTEWAFSIPLLIIFVLLTVVMFVVGKNAASNQNPYMFSRAFLAFTFAKIMFSMLMILVYEKMNEGGDRLYLISFLVVYLSFTIYETLVFMKLSQTPGKNQKE